MKKKQLREMWRRRCYSLAGRTMSDRSLWVASQIAELSRTAYGASYREVIASGNWEAIIRFDGPRPADYENSERFAIDYLLGELLSKMGPSATGASPDGLREVALSKFKDSEGQCQETNQRLTVEFQRLGSAEFDPIVRLARRKIAATLGKFCWDEASKHFSHGSKASTRLPRARGDLYYKFGGIPDTTALCETLSKIAIASIRPWQGAEPENWSDCKVNLVVGNRITTVPKTAKTDRTIAIEPCMNMFVQKGIGRMIRSRLRRRGVNLNDQSINQSLARLGSLDGSLATIDLSAASDTISTKVVELLLPPDWFDAMNITRSHYGVWTDGTVKRYQKFSTMGNGFTFELESLIFWALCSAVVDNLGLADKRIGVYGDDLIVSPDAYESLTYTLTRFGFTQNAKKSYATGPFRESCGKHWFYGRDVSPFYIREGVVDVTRELLVVNNFRRWANSVYSGFIPPKVWSIYETLRDSLIPEQWVRDIKIPDGFGDLGVVSSFSEALPQRSERGLEGWNCDILQLTPPPKQLVKRLRKKGPSLLAKGLWNLETNNQGSTVVEPVPSTVWEEFPYDFKVNHELLKRFREEARKENRIKMLNDCFGPASNRGETCSDELPIHSGKLRLKISKLDVGRWEDVGSPLI
jgi:hypothetical protein